MGGLGSSARPREEKASFLEAAAAALLLLGELCQQQALTMEPV